MRPLGSKIIRGLVIRVLKAHSPPDTHHQRCERCQKPDLGWERNAGHFCPIGLSISFKIRGLSREFLRYLNMVSNLMKKNLSDLEVPKPSHAPEDGRKALQDNGCRNFDSGGPLPLCPSVDASHSFAGARSDSINNPNFVQASQVGLGNKKYDAFDQRTALGGDATRPRDGNLRDAPFQDTLSLKTAIQSLSADSDKQCVTCPTGGAADRKHS